MKPFEIGNYRVRPALGAADLAACQALRHLAFFGREGRDEDGFDGPCTHMMIEAHEDDALVGAFRMLHMRSGRQIAESYSAQFYDLGRLEHYEGTIVEIGRFCIAPERADPDILRAAWGALTRYVDDNRVDLLIGCASFDGVETAPYRDAFAMLKARHLAPERWRPRIKAAQVFRYAEELTQRPDLRQATAEMPPLLRSYLAMGGWVSDHAVIDDGLGTLHVFTGVEIKAIPDARKRLLRQAAASAA